MRARKGLRVEERKRENETGRLETDVNERKQVIEVKERRRAGMEKKSK